MLLVPLKDGGNGEWVLLVQPREGALGGCVKVAALGDAELGRRQLLLGRGKVFAGGEEFIVPSLESHRPLS